MTDVQCQTSPLSGNDRLPEGVVVYPHEPPALLATLEVAPGVRWIRMPMPTALDHVNVWAIEDGDGWAIVDTGLRTDETVAAWNAILAAAGITKITRVLVTHMHPDHVGLAGWLTRRYGCRLWMSRLEYLSCRSLVADSGREAPPDALAFYVRAGWGEASMEAYKARFGIFGNRIHPLPDTYRRVHDGEEFRIGSYTWRVVVGNGHSPEHACFHCPGLKVFISGDQVLPKISSNVSVHAMEPDANPMADWLESLAQIRAKVPDDVLVLPAHNSCFHGLHARLDHLMDSQQRALGRLRDALSQPIRVVDAFAALFSRPISADNAPLLGMATGESQACLNYLVATGEARSYLDEAGVAWYQSTASTA